MTDPQQRSPAGSPESPVQARLDRAEREIRRLRRLVVGTLLAVAALLGVASAIVVVAARRGMPGFLPLVVESREFMLRDADGRIRGAWGFDDEGSVRLVLQDHRTRTSVKLNLLDDGATGLTFADSAGNPRLVVGVLPDQTANLVFGDARGITRTVLGLNRDGSSTLIFADKRGQTRTAFGVDSQGRPMVSSEPLPAGTIPDTAVAKPDSSAAAQSVPKKKRGD